MSYQMAKTFSERHMNNLKELLEKKFVENEMIYYEIRVDGKPVVMRTKDPDAFDGYKAFMDDETKTVQVIFYGKDNPKQKRGTEYHFKIVRIDHPKPVSNELNGMDISKEIQRRLDEYEEQRRVERLEKENIEMAQRLSEQQQLIETLNKELEEYKSRKLYIGNLNLLEGLSHVAEHMIRRNPQWLSKAGKLGEALSGMISRDNEYVSDKDSEEEESEVSFQKASEPSLTEEEKHRLDFLKQIEEKVTDKKHQDLIFDILNYLCAQTSEIESVYRLIQHHHQKKNS